MAGRNNVNGATNAILERITAVLEEVVPAHQQGPVEFRGLAEFRKSDPPRYVGNYDPDGAQRWLQELEKIFRTMECTDNQKVTFATYMLAEEAESWWTHAKQLLEAEHRAATWEVFKERFLEKYFPEDIRRRKELEFLELKQDTLSVGEYAARFEELIKFSPYFQNNPDERSKCVKFENGLRPDLKSTFSYQGIRNFPVLVNKCRIYEGDLRIKAAYEKEQQSQKSYGPQRHKDQKEKGHQANQKPYQQGKSGMESSKPASTPEGTLRANPPRCEKCNKFHYGPNCYGRELICYACQKPGHYAHNCPTRPKEELNAVRGKRRSQ